MRFIHLPGSERATTQLGYGCSSLMGALGMKESLALLEAAYAAGIRHFDVARTYGFGQAEACVGEFRQRHADITITTKYGIPAAKNPGFVSIARRIVRPVLRAVPALKQQLSRAASTVSAPGEPKSSFTVEDAQFSLEKSLRELRTDCIDLWLLHEVEATDLTDERFYRFLEDAVQQGKIAAYGVASGRDRVPELLAQRPEYCGVVQCEWSMYPESFSAGRAFRVFHRVLREAYPDLQATLSGDPSACRDWSGATGVDLADEKKLRSLILKAALAGNPEGIVLVSTKNPGHLKQNIDVAENDSLIEPALRLLGLVQGHAEQRFRETEAGVV